MTQTFPLQWPALRPRTPSQRKKNWPAPLYRDVVRRALYEELRISGCKEVIITTDIPVRVDGAPIANRRDPADQGVAVYFSRKGKRVCIAIDQYFRITENMHAIAKSIEALRALERWGGEAIMDTAVSGFTLLEGPGVSAKPENWRVWFLSSLGSVPASQAALSDMYRAAARDNASDETFLRDLNIARDAARKELS